MQGITPAWAGKSWLSLDSCLLWWDHPRMGGEKQNMLMQMGYNTGSPPRGRGKANPSICENLERRITPAWAGKRLIDSLSRQLTGDHPRVGGEKHAAPFHNAVCVGSPPRGRGKGGLLSAGLYDLGITPAWAGKRRNRKLRRRMRQDHPRVGGEKAIDSICLDNP